MPVPSLIGWLGALRQVDARRRRNAVTDGLIAARGSEDGVRSLLRALDQAADPAPRRAGGAKDLERLLGGEA